ncbi:uncharacterized protein LOC131659038 [Vicia villosa]|uniref:uncharacterized protein LOC131659038 n=1 Tax=Vicia villosa TaxID=3911 RepID=UPI00273A9E8E|nr:uncharacterized protein LOC131659038 [Vicia villosa]
MSEEKLVRKILRSLPKIFAMKVTAIDEAQDISKMKVDELIGSIQTFEMSISDIVEKKNKSIAFKARRNVKNTPSNNDKSYDSSKRSKPEENSNEGKGIQCHRCEGYGHIRAECPTYLKEKMKGLSVTWSKGDSESESEEETAKHIIALTSVCVSDDDSSEDELTFDELAASYKELCVRSAEVCKQVEKQKILIKELKTEKKEHLVTIDSLNGEISMLNSKLDQILFGYPNNTHQDKLKQGTPLKNQQWVANSVALIAHTSLKVSAKEDWYLDSGCSKYMSVMKNLLVDIKPHFTKYVTLGNGVKREIIGVGKLKGLGVLTLNNVFLVKGLTANLISISQLCDQGFNIRFT